MFRQITQIISRPSLVLRCRSVVRSSNRFIATEAEDGNSSEKAKTAKKKEDKEKKAKLASLLRGDSMEAQKNGEKSKLVDSSFILSRWSPFYFRDLGNGKMKKVFADLEQTIHASKLYDNQNRYLTVLIQGSGCGKTHLIHQYCLNHRAIFMQFLQGSHLELLSILKDFIVKYQLEHDITDNILSEYAEELEFTKTAFRATSLLPLTFIDFADRFLQNDDGSRQNELNETLLRMTQSSSEILENMFKENLKKYATNSKQFESFKSEMYEAAAKMKLEAIIYDQVMAFKTMHRLFLNHPFESPLAFERLGEERDEPDESKYSVDPFTHTTSLLYLLRVAIEDLVKTANIPVANDFELPLHEVGLRERLKVRQFYWTESPEELWQRFYSQVNTALELDKPENAELAAKVGSLQPFAVRANYLWPFWTVLSERAIKESKPLIEVVDCAVKSQQTLVAMEVAEYAKLVLRHPQEKFLVQAALGRRYILGDQKDLSNLLETGIIPLPAGYERFMEQLTSSEVVIPLCDPFAMHHLQSQVSSVDQLFNKIAYPSSKEYDAEIFGEAVAFGVLSKFKNCTLDSIADGADTVLQQYNIREEIRLHDILDLSLTNYSKFAHNLGVGSRYNHIFTPAMPIHHDLAMFQNSAKLPIRHHSFAVGLTSENNIEAVLCIQSKFHDDITLSVAEEAFKSLEPGQLYLNAPEKLKKTWEEMKSQVKTRHIWIRAISGRKVSLTVLLSAKEHNEKNPYQPVLILTPEMLNHSTVNEKLPKQDSYDTSDSEACIQVDCFKMTNRFFDSTVLTAQEKARFLRS